MREDILTTMAKNPDISTKIQKTVSDITKYFDFFERLAGYLGDRHFQRIFVYSPMPDKNEHLRYASVFDIGLKGQMVFDPFVHTPILMKYFGKYYNTTQDRFFPLACKAYAGVGDNSPKKYREILVGQLNIQPKVFNSEVDDVSIRGRYFTATKSNSPQEFGLLNRGITRLLHETAEDFELKILEKVLIEMADMYVFYKQCVVLGIKEAFDLPDEFDSV